MYYWALYIMMLISFGALSIQNPDPKMRIIGVLLTVVNALIFWR